jgi:aminoglycoside phosphotransferase (APT) family kinase protein
MAVTVTDVPRAVAAAISAASALGLAVESAVILHASNRLALRLLPADIVARVALAAHGAAQLEVELAARLAALESPAAAPDPRVPPRVHERDGFAITLWTYYEPKPSRELSPAAYADALSRLHQGMRHVDLPTPHFLERVQEAEQIVANLGQTPELSETDRELLTSAFTSVTRAISERGAAEQLLHGEPHRGNILNTKAGPLFIDLETACRGPVEFDLAHVPEAVSERYPDIDHELLAECRLLVLAMVAAWRLDPGDQLPNRERATRDLLAALRAGPPYPTLDAIAGPE